MARSAILGFPRRRSADQPRPAAALPGNLQQAIIDIGSNSVRLVVYAGPPRAPSVIFNEKVMAGLGRGLATSGRIDDEAMARGLMALRRFAGLVREFGVEQTICVATAAVREATNGPEIMAAARAYGLDVRLLNGDEEGETSGYGVISGIPDANGVVADLGGGSLELVRIGPADDGLGAVGKRVSLPLGVLRLPSLLAAGKAGLADVRRTIADGLTRIGWDADDAGVPLYLVGGSWRSLARLDMHVQGDLLPVMHQHDMPAGCVERLEIALATMDQAALRQVPGLSGSRIPMLGDATALLRILQNVLAPSRFIISSTGLREGLLYQALPADIRRQDPLLVAARDEGRRLARFPEHGRLIDQWIAPLFDRDAPGQMRLRLAACMLADVAWSANPGFRAERGVDIALHGNWLGATVADRYVIAQTLFSAFGGGAKRFAEMPGFIVPERIERAIAWGLAIRLGQRLSGGAARPLQHSRLVADDAHVRLELSGDAALLNGEAVGKRLNGLAAFLKRTPIIAAD